MSDNTTVNVKIHDHVKNKKVDVTVNANDVIAKVKEDLVNILNVPAKDQQLIFAGKIMKDSETFQDNNIVEGSTVHMVPKLSARQQTSSSPTTTTNNTSSNNTTTTTTPSTNPTTPLGNSNNIFSQLGGLGGLGALGGLGGQNMNQMRQQLMQNPEMMDQIMNSPMMVTNEQSKDDGRDDKYDAKQSTNGTYFK